MRIRQRKGRIGEGGGESSRQRDSRTKDLECGEVVLMCGSVTGNWSQDSHGGAVSLGRNQNGSPYH